MTYNIILFSDISKPLHGKGMGVYRLANHLRDHNYTVKVIHSFIRITDLEFEMICDEYISKDTIVVGLGATVLADLEIGNFFGIPTNKVKSRFKKIKEKFPWVSTCVGGSQITGSSDQFISTLSFFDFAVKGQGETVFLALADHLSNRVPLQTSSITKPKIVTDKSYPFNEFNQTFNIFNHDDSIVHGEGLPIEIARGCIFKCKFCGYDLIGKKAGEFTKQSNLIRKEIIENYNQWGTTDYYVADETINDSMDKINMLVDAVSGLPFKPTFGGFLRLDLIWKYPEMAQKLLDFGLEACSFGIETINDKSGKAVGKGLGTVRIDETLDHIRTVWKDKVFVNASFILGLKYDTPGTAQQLDQWLEEQFFKKNIHEVFVKPLYILPSTGTSYLDQFYLDQGYSLLDNEFENKNEYTRTAEEGQCMSWKTQYYNYVDASKDAEQIHKKFNQQKICKGKIGKHNFAFIKSILPEQYQKFFIQTMIHDIPFPGLTVDETESVIYNAYNTFNKDYIKSILKISKEK
jgi:radical SAM superfamily enzyme YgiQ (UPF0313 family)